MHQDGIKICFLDNYQYICPYSPKKYAYETVFFSPCDNYSGGFM